MVRTVRARLSSPCLCGGEDGVPLGNGVPVAQVCHLSQGLPELAVARVLATWLPCPRPPPAHALCQGRSPVPETLRVGLLGLVCVFVLKMVSSAAGGQVLPRRPRALLAGGLANADGSASDLESREGRPCTGEAGRAS